VAHAVIPKLYDEDYDIAGSKYGVLNCNGYGFLNTCQKCFVEEKTSGVYTLEMELLTTDRYAENVLPNTFVKIIPNKMHDPQLFQIYRVKEEGKKLSVSGYHIKYLAQNNQNYERNFHENRQKHNKNCAYVKFWY
jgi:phage-related protein